MFYQSGKLVLSLLFTHVVSATGAADSDVAMILLCLLQVGFWRKWLPVLHQYVSSHYESFLWVSVNTVFSSTHYEVQGDPGEPDVFWMGSTR